MREEATMEKRFEVVNREKGGIKDVTRFILLRIAPSGGGGKQSDQRFLRSNFKIV
jgi:hypothetical protein